MVVILTEEYISYRRIIETCNLIRKYIDMKTVSGLFTLEIDVDGNLFAVYPDGTIPPKFEYNADTGALYFITDD